MTIWILLVAKRVCIIVREQRAECRSITAGRQGWLTSVELVLQVAMRLSNIYEGAENRPPQRRRQMLEYPGAPPPKPERYEDREFSVLSVLSVL